MIARSPFCLAVLLFSTLLFLQANADNAMVTCGSSVKLQHVPTKYRLHSHEVSYSGQRGGSTQQSVTGFPTGDDAGSYWSVHGPPSQPCIPGTPLNKGSPIRMQHIQTRKWLHSHLMRSPITSNQEVSAFGDDASSDTGDVWEIEWRTKGKFWKQDTKISLRHKDTGRYLASHAHARFGHPIHNQQEVCAVDYSDNNAEWTCAEGVYMPRNDINATEADSRDEL